VKSEPYLVSTTANAYKSSKKKIEGVSTENYIYKHLKYMVMGFFNPFTNQIKDTK